MRRIKLVLAMAAVLVGMLALQAGPAMADDEDCDFRERGNRDDVVVCRDDGDREVFEADDFYYDDDFFLDVDDSFYYSPFLYYSPFFYIEEIDIDCDEIDDDSDGWVDEGAVCEALCHSFREDFL